MKTRYFVNDDFVWRETDDHLLVYSYNGQNWRTSTYLSVKSLKKERPRIREVFAEELALMDTKT